MRATIFIILLLACFQSYSQEISRGDTIFIFGDTLLIGDLKGKEIIGQNSRVNSEGFTELPSSVNGINLGSAEWVDYNSDGFLDIFINGFKIGDDDISHATLFKNQGNNTFAKADINSFTRAIYGDQDWGDFNNDGHIDLILTGTTSGFNSENVTEIHKNLGNDSFVEIAHSLPRMSRSDVHWEDLDNDGDLDIFLMGLDSNLEFLARIYVNNGGDNFSQGPDILTGGSGRINFNDNASVWADFDSDGDVDGVLGYSSQTGGYGVKLFENAGNLKFIEKSGSFPQLNYLTLDVFDFNNDNLFDLVISGNKVASTGSNEESAFLVIMENKGGLAFAEFYNQKTGTYWGSIDCGDFNNDGFSDVLINGHGNRNQETFILENNSGLNFQVRNFGLTPTHSGGGHWGKINASGNLDIYIHGTTTGSSTDATSKLFLNSSNIENLPPGVPNGISYSFENNELHVQWNASTDDHTGSDGISYNVRLGTSDGTFEIIEGHSTYSGSRKVIENGNNGFNKTFTFKNLAEGRYYFGVQSIDNAFNSSPYSETIVICSSQKFNLPDTVYKCRDEDYPVSVSESFSNLTWSTGETDNDILITHQGLYRVEALNRFGCPDKDSIMVIDVIQPLVDLGPDIISCETPSLILDATFADSEYRWMDNSTNPTYEVTDFGTYRVEVRNSCGISVDTVKFSRPENIGFIPNVFTPNNDGKNDFFEVKSAKDRFHLQVFNRFGNLIYKSNAYKNEWNGAGLPSGVYYYFIQDYCGKTYKGYVTILR